MATDRADDLRAFRDFIDAQLANGGAGMTPGEALDLWEYENTPEDEKQETMLAIRRGLEDADAGRTEDAFAFVARMRRKIREIGGR
jgi:hypothetical protein